MECDKSGTNCGLNFYSLPSRGVPICNRLFAELYSPPGAGAWRQCYVLLALHVAQKIFEYGREMRLQIGGDFIDTTLDEPRGDLYVRVIYPAQFEWLEFQERASLQIGDPAAVAGHLRCFVLGGAPKCPSGHVPTIQFEIMSEAVADLPLQFGAPGVVCMDCPRALHIGVTEFNGELWGTTCALCNQRVKHLQQLRLHGAVEAVTLDSLGHGDGLCVPLPCREYLVIGRGLKARFPTVMTAPNQANGACVHVFDCNNPGDTQKYRDKLSDAIWQAAQASPCPPFCAVRLGA